MLALSVRAYSPHPPPPPPPPSEKENATNRILCEYIQLEIGLSELQSTLSKEDTLGTKATVWFREVSALERVQLQRYKWNSAGSGPHLLSGLECPRRESWLYTAQDRLKLFRATLSEPNDPYVIL